MILQDSVDFDILNHLSGQPGGRNTAGNIAEEIGYSRSHVSRRLRSLVNDELVKKIGPSPKSGLYEITEKGRKAAEIGPELYKQDQEEFERQVAESAT